MLLPINMQLMRSSSLIRLSMMQLRRIFITLSITGSADRAITHVGIVIPAHNEAEDITQCLSAVIAACKDARSKYKHLDISIWCIADNCTDGTEDIVLHNFTDIDNLHLLQVDFRKPGLTRDYGIQQFFAYVRQFSSRPAHNAWVAMTDADTVVPLNWLTDQITAANNGTDCVVGTVEPRKSELGDQVYNLWRERHDFCEGHKHIFGANLGVRASAYQHVGGFLPLLHSEDSSLVTAVEAAGFEMLKTDRIRAVTSGRVQGRVVHGFSTYLADLIAEKTAQANVSVQPAEAVGRLLETPKALSTHW